MLALALAAGLIAVSASVPAAHAGSKPCRLHADTKPKKLSKQNARSALVCLINRRRTKHGLKPLQRSKELRRAAQRHSERMEGGNCFAHQCYGEASLDGRLRDVGYLGGGVNSWMCAENIAWGLKRYGTPRATVNAWMQSPGHRANILSGSFRDVGVGFADGTPVNAHANGGVYTADFGVRKR
jgi:uncharacterized protein YkwD